MSKTILVTGGSRGIGKDIAISLARDGYNVVLNYNKSESEAKKIKEDLQKENINIEIFKADVSKSKEVEKLIEFVIKKFGKVDILINNAGISKFGLLQDMTEEDFDNVLNVNLKSMFLLSKNILPFMIKKKEGLIINIASIWGEIGASCESIYSASKAGVIGFTKALAKEVGPSNIRVNAISPGFINTDMNKNISKEAVEDIKQEIPLGRIGEAIDITRCVKWLIEDNYTTGQIVSINGGWN